MGKTWWGNDVKRAARLTLPPLSLFGETWVADSARNVAEPEPPKKAAAAKNGCPTILPAVFAAVAAVSAAAAATESAVLFGTRFVDFELPSVEITAVQGLDRPVGFGPVGHFDEAEPPGAAGVAVRDDANAFDGPVLRKQRPDRVFGGPEGQISYKNILH
jgi:hypothetical protein